MGGLITGAFRRTFGENGVDVAVEQNAIEDLGGETVGMRAAACGFQLEHLVNGRPEPCVRDAIAWSGDLRCSGGGLG